MYERDVRTGTAWITAIGRRYFITRDRKAWGFAEHTDPRDEECPKSRAAGRYLPYDGGDHRRRRQTAAGDPQIAQPVPPAADRRQQLRGTVQHSLEPAERAADRPGHARTLWHHRGGRDRVHPVEKVHTRLFRSRRETERLPQRHEGRFA